MYQRALRRKTCRFCEAKATAIDYKDVKTLRAYVTERGKIISRRVSGTCARHHRMLDRAIQRARNIALLPFTDK
ncbi:MAG: 30S ribosomal protein S18 [Nitrospirae bacterium]|nr:MAG: 30S ribosomal protein S18 [Nitrospirota bacterium]